MTPPRRGADWLPDRGEVIWIDHNPQVGREMKNHHPFLVLSTAPFHRVVGLVVGCAMTSAASNQGSSLALDLGPIPDRADAHSFVLCHQIKSFDWKARGARPHPMGQLKEDQLDAVLDIMGQILGFIP
ncbi:MAG: type II toxin-antitoxin system PemK/MazF family toxin [Cyanobacteria bacterium K_Offshore_surface_m2_239]|nr:type II toxin-antitoxin system PemK/MazF family toxin [Cyanobacteria bacterium K_Offshore_surface_m2_239]